MSRYKKEINEVSVTATNERTLEIMLKKITNLWYKTDFHLCPYHTETAATLIISSAEDIMAMLEDSQVTITTIKGSCFVGPIKVKLMWECLKAYKEMKPLFFKPILDLQPNNDLS